MISQFPEQRVFYGLSTDSKPLKADGVRNGDKLIEVNITTDSVKKYVFDTDGDQWILASEDSEINKATIGGYGGKYIATTDATEPDTGYVFTAIQVLSDAVITLVGNITGITSVSVLAGTVIYGRYTSCTLASGSVIAYQGV